MSALTTSWWAVLGELGLCPPSSPMVEMLSKNCHPALINIDNQTFQIESVKR